MHDRENSIKGYKMMVRRKSMHSGFSRKNEKKPLAAALDSARRCYARGDLEQAILNLRQVLAISPRHAAALTMREEIEAEFCQTADYFRSQFITRPQDPALHRAYANYLHRANRFSDSIDHYRQAIALDPDNARAHYGLGRVYSTLGRPEEAKQCFQAAISRKPDYIDAKYFLAGLGEESRFGTAKLEYVSRLFDMAADTFDRHLEQDLGYRTPALLKTAVDKIIGVSSPELDILDLGCGTGLSGIPFKNLARTLTGVDLSPGMLAKARERGIYDSLFEAELVDFLNDKGNAYDLVLAADVFIYVGDLEAVFSAVSTSLRDGGFFAFSVESCSGNGYTLRGSARYAHSDRYVSETAERRAFDVVMREAITVRKENADAIKGDIFILHKTR